MSYCWDFRYQREHEHDENVDQKLDVSPQHLLSDFLAYLYSVLRTENGRYWKGMKCFFDFQSPEWETHKYPTRSMSCTLWRVPHTKKKPGKARLPFFCVRVAVVDGAVVSSLDY